MNVSSVIDRAVAFKYGPLLAGIDEVGMGPIAGPICACALVIIPERANCINLVTIQVDDSKKLTEGQRELLYPKIVQNSFVGIGWTKVWEIERFKNLHYAGMLARARALKNLLRVMAPQKPDAIVIDYFNIDTTIPVVAIPKADAQSFVVAAASIVAKCRRDWYMVKRDKRHPFYSWRSNKGYRVQSHFEGLLSHGLSPVHRKYLIDMKHIKDKLGRK